MAVAWGSVMEFFLLHDQSKIGSSPFLRSSATDSPHQRILNNSKNELFETLWQFLDIFYQSIKFFVESML